jgi:hypothetical protein
MVLVGARIVSIFLQRAERCADANVRNLFLEATVTLPAFVAVMRKAVGEATDDAEREENGEDRVFHAMFLSFDSVKGVSGRGEWERSAVPFAGVAVPMMTHSEPFRSDRIPQHGSLLGIEDRMDFAERLDEIRLQVLESFLPRGKPSLCPRLVEGVGAQHLCQHRSRLQGFPRCALPRLTEA